ncbi:MAG: hypothetical protein M1830_007365 [Pleopsidium flavum]|nr:MAG: hypothetical protein M1830_007365 [Pleopsidium flavum]
MAFSEDKSFESVSGESETLEPAGAGVGPSTRTATENGTLPQPSSSVQSTKKTTRTASLTSVPTSTTNSPKPSRETSPIRPPLKPGISSIPKSTRSRKNSQDFSPNHAPSGSGSNIPSVPSAAAVQRALSALGTPQLPTPTASETSVETTRPPKARRSGTGESTPHWPTSPRLKSPPPSATSTRPSVFSSRKSDQGALTPSIFVERPTPSSTPLIESSASTTDIESEDTTPRSGMRTPARGASGTASVLETVQESSLPATPAIGTVQGPSDSKPTDDARPERIAENPMEEAFARSTRAVPESGSESGGNKSGSAKSNDKGHRKSAIASNSARANTVLPRKSLTHLNSTRGKVGNEGSVRNMTVETETVSSIPQVAVGGGAGDRGVLGRTDTVGSLRLKPSAETIRPKKEKKKVVRKTPSVNSGTGSRLGTASSKADIFEAKVASAVDEANSSDAEETFVYESNPPDTHPSRPNRFHSRTPSTTSMASQADQYGGRSRQSLVDGHQSIAGKKSMKFASNAYNSSGLEGDTADHAGGGGPTGSGRANGGVAAHHHHHIGRYGRGGGGHTSLFDTESPFPHAARQLRTTAGNNTRLSQRPSSPRNPHALRLVGTSKKPNGVSTYDIDDEGADDERTPLFNSVRSNRTRGRGRPNSGSILQSEYNEEKEQGCCGRAAGWLVLTALVLLLISAVVGGLLGFSKPLHDVYVKDIRNVLASEQEIMLDLHVHAVNSNLIAIQVSDLDVNIFAKSKHVVTNALWKDSHVLPYSYLQKRKRRSPGLMPSSVKHSPADTSLQYYVTHGVDEGNDPIEDPEGDSQTMLLGRIFEFDSPLIFEASPLRRRSLSSVGELRLAKPGNKTEEGGTERWEKVIQYPFELIVRGVLKYQLPLSSRVRTASIGASVIVHPDEGLDDMGNMRISKTYALYPAGSNVVLHRAGQHGYTPLRFDS